MKNAWTEKVEAQTAEIERLRAEAERLKHNHGHLKEALDAAGIYSSAIESCECAYKSRAESAERENAELKGLMSEIIARVWDKSKDEYGKYMVTIVITKDQHDQIEQILKGYAMNWLRLELNKQAIDPKNIDGQDRDLLAEIAYLEAKLEKAIEYIDRKIAVYDQYETTFATPRSDLSSIKQILKGETP